MNWRITLPLIIFLTVMPFPFISGAGLGELPTPQDQDMPETSTLAASSVAVSSSIIEALAVDEADHQGEIKEPVQKVKHVKKVKHSEPVYKYSNGGESGEPCEQTGWDTIETGEPI